MTSLPPVVNSYLAFCEVRAQFRRTGRLQLDASFVFPTTLLPLAVIVETTGRPLHASNPAVQGYADWIVLSGDPSPGGTYVPFIRLPSQFASCKDILERLEDLSVSTQLFSGNRDAYHYLLSELIDNIYQHADARHAYVMAQFYRKKGLMEASFMDDGLTIPRSLRRGTGVNYTPMRAFQAILDAIRGKSAKPGGQRGFGLQTTVRIANALGGEALVVSGRGAILASSDGNVVAYSLATRQALDGTLVSLRFPEGNKKVNLYDLVEG